MSLPHTGSGYVGKSSTELGRFLRARRAETGPEEVAIKAGPGLCRTPVLRREELATLAGMSIDYYARLERGREIHPGPAVLDALPQALRLGEVDHKHLHDLGLRAARRPSPDRSAPSRSVNPGTELLPDRLRPFPARVLSRTMDLLAADPGGPRTLAGIERRPAGRRNIAKYVFLHPAARELHPDWEVMTPGSVARSAPWRAPTRTLPASPNSSANCSSRARSSRDCGSGSPTTCGRSPTATRPCTTPTSALSPSAARPC